MIGSTKIKEIFFRAEQPGNLIHIIRFCIRKQNLGFIRIDFSIQIWNWVSMRVSSRIIEVLPILRTTPGLFLIDLFYCYDDGNPCYITLVYIIRIGRKLIFVNLWPEIRE
ncbi:MAG: hypothetical protein JXR52_01995 [Bacteroidales bacterium]|nr:hypothetical protein [Bacteroidales bacterium]MBN2697572.1 hypothetical protein [Bacteroidales bacterium]